MNKLNRPRTSLFKRVSKTFIAGLLAALPLVLTLAAIVWLVDFIQRFLGPKSEFGKLWKSIGLQFISSETAAYIIGVLVTLILIFMLGLVVQTGLKYRWQAMVDGIMEGLPLVRTIYNALNKLTRMFEQREEADMKAMRAVMCHFGGKGGTAVLPEVVHLNGHDYNAVLIPTAPVPFGGAILYVPVEWVEPADMEFDGLFNIYMSMGATSTDYLHRQAAQGSREESQ
jgi:uncharacterized membrane protein